MTKLTLAEAHEEMKEEEEEEVDDDGHRQLLGFKKVS